MVFAWTLKVAMVIRKYVLTFELENYKGPENWTEFHNSNWILGPELEFGSYVKRRVWSLFHNQNW
jgi:hypothetical protein